MKYNRILILLFILNFITYGCYDPYFKLMENHPNMVSLRKLSINADSVTVELKFDFPPKYIKKKIIFQFLPKIVIDNDTINLEAVNFYGIKTDSKMNIISYKYGEEFLYTDHFALDKSKIKLLVYYEAKARYGKKELELNLPPEIIFIYEKADI